MNSSNELETTETINLASMDEEQITMNYLHQHHDFFNQHQELLLSLKIPHLCGEAVSLIERQVSLFREQNTQLKNNLNELLHIAKENDRSNLRMHKLSLALLDCKGLDNVEVILDEILCDDFSVDSVALKLFIEPVNDQPEYLFEKADSVLVKELEKLLHQRKPVCGFFKNLPLRPLFGEKKWAEKTDNIVSLAVIPLFIEKNRCFGALVLGSQNIGRFNTSMGTHFLEKLGDILSHLLARIISV